MVYRVYWAIKQLNLFYSSFYLKNVLPTLKVLYSTNGLSIIFILK